MNIAEYQMQTLTQKKMTDLKLKTKTIKLPEENREQSLLLWVK